MEFFYFDKVDINEDVIERLIDLINGWIMSGRMNENWVLGIEVEI